MAEIERWECPTHGTEMKPPDSRAEGQPLVCGAVTGDPPYFCQRRPKLVRYVPAKEYEKLQEELARAKRYGETTYGVEQYLRKSRDKLYDENEALQKENERLNAVLDVIKDGNLTLVEYANLRVKLERSRT